THRVRQRRRDSVSPQKATQPILVLAQLDHRSRWQKHAARKTPPPGGERPDLHVRGRDPQVDADSRDHARQVPEEGAIRRSMHQEVTICRRLLEYEAVAM